jgi:CheY-like chemotaxis protein
LTATHDEAAPFDARPCYRIAVFGLGPRFQRLLEIIVKHARHNNYRYQVAEHRGPGEFDIALVDMTAKGGVEVARTLKSVPQALPVIGVGRRSNHRRGNDDLLLATFSLDVLGVLNRAAESLSLRERTRRLSTRLVQADASLRLPVVAGRAPRALVIEPSPSVRSQLAAALRQIGVDAEGVGALAQAEEVLSMRSYELMILEPQQPDGDGLTMLRRLRHEPGGRKLSMPVIVLSSRSGMLDLAKAAWAGCNGYLGKPVPLSTLHATVNRVLLRYLRQRLDAERKARGMAASPISPSMASTMRSPLPSPLMPAASSATTSPKLEARLSNPSTTAGTLESALAALQARSAYAPDSLRGLGTMGAAGALPGKREAQPSLREGGPGLSP